MSRAVRTTQGMHRFTESYLRTVTRMHEEQVSREARRSGRLSSTDRRRFRTSWQEWVALMQSTPPAATWLEESRPPTENEWYSLTDYYNDARRSLVLPTHRDVCRYMTPPEPTPETDTSGIPTTEAILADLRVLKERANELGNIRGFTCTERTISFPTGPIVLEFDDHRIPIGSYNIRVSANNLSYRILRSSRNYTRWEVNNSYSGGWSSQACIHPHIRGNGAVCVGNAGTTLNNLIRTGSLFDLREFVMHFLTQYNEASPYFALAHSRLIRVNELTGRFEEEIWSGVTEPVVAAPDTPEPDVFVVDPSYPDPSPNTPPCHICNATLQDHQRFTVHGYWGCDNCSYVFDQQRYWHAAGQITVDGYRVPARWPGVTFNSSTGEYSLNGDYRVPTGTPREAVEVSREDISHMAVTTNPPTPLSSTTSNISATTPSGESITGSTTTPTSSPTRLVISEEVQALARSTLDALGETSASPNNPFPSFAQWQEAQIQRGQIDDETTAPTEDQVAADAAADAAAEQAYEELTDSHRQTLDSPPSQRAWMQEAPIDDTSARPWDNPEELPF